MLQNAEGESAFFELDFQTEKVIPHELLCTEG